MPELSVAVVIITRNRLESLKYCLACIANQTHPADELIIVDNGDDTSARDFLAEQYPQAQYIHCVTALGNQTTMRNLGLGRAQSDIIATTDDDGYPQPQWLAEILRCYEPGVGAVGGRLLQGDIDEGKGPSHPSVGTMTAIAGAKGNFNALWTEPFDVDHLQGTNMTFRRELLIRMGGWDTALDQQYGIYTDDTEVCLRIKRLGARVIYSPHAIVQHGLEPRGGGLGRDIGLSPRVAYILSRGAIYTILRTYQFKPRIAVGAVILAPLANIARVLLPKQEGKSGRSLSLSTIRLRAAAAILGGHLDGIWSVVRGRTGNSWPRLHLT